MKYIWHDGDFVPAEDYRPDPPLAQSGLPCPHIMGDLAAYKSPLSFETIEGRAQRREEMKRFGVREVEPSERPEGIGISKTKAEAEAERKQLEARPKYTMPEAVKRKLMAGK